MVGPATSNISDFKMTNKSKPISLHPLDPKKALKALLETKSPKKDTKAVLKPS